MTNQRPHIHYVAVIGAGSIGERHIRCFAATGRAEVAFVEPRDEVRAQVAGRNPAAAGSASMDDVMERPLDAAIIATPAPLHVTEAIELARRGVHLLIEKPLSLSLDRVDEVARVVAGKPVVAGA